MFEFCGRRASLAQAVAGELEPVSVVDDAIEDGVSDGRHADSPMPAIDRNLAGDDERASVVSVLDDLQQIACLPTKASGL